MEEPTRRRLVTALYRLAHEEQRCVTPRTLAQHLKGIKTSEIKDALKGLYEEGVVGFTPSPKGTPGRPTTYWFLARAPEHGFDGYLDVTEASPPIDMPRPVYLLTPRTKYGHARNWSTDRTEGQHHFTRPAIGSTQPALTGLTKSFHPEPRKTLDDDRAEAKSDLEPPDDEPDAPDAPDQTDQTDQTSQTSAQNDQSTPESGAEQEDLPLSPHLTHVQPETAFQHIREFVTAYNAQHGHGPTYFDINEHLQSLGYSDLEAKKYFILLESAHVAAWYPGGLQRKPGLDSDPEGTGRYGLRTEGWWGDWPATEEVRIGTERRVAPEYQRRIVGLGLEDI